MIFQERKMLSDLQRGTLLSKFHQQTANRKHRRDAKSAKRRISERKPATTAKAAQHTRPLLLPMLQNLPHRLCVLSQHLEKMT